MYAHFHARSFVRLWVYMSITVSLLVACWGVPWCEHVPFGRLWANWQHLSASLWGQQACFPKELCETDRHQRWHLSHKASRSVNEFQASCKLTPTKYWGGVAEVLTEHGWERKPLKITVSGAWINTALDECSKLEWCVCSHVGTWDEMTEVKFVCSFCWSWLWPLLIAGGVTVEDTTLSLLCSIQKMYLTNSWFWLEVSPAPRSPTLLSFSSFSQQHLLQQAVHPGFAQQLCKVERLHHLPGHTLQGRQDEQQLPEPPPPLTGGFLQQQLGLEAQMSNHLRNLQAWTVWEAEGRGRTLVWTEVRCSSI